MHVLQFATRKSWPLDTGAKLRNYCLARGISADADVTLLAFEEEHASTEARAGLGDFYQSVVTVPRDRGYTPTKIVKGAIGPTPLPLLNYTTEAMKAALTRLLSDQNFDIVQMESIHLFTYLPILRAAVGKPLLVLDWHNIESELMWRYSERESNFLRKTYARRVAGQIRKCEQTALATLDGHVSVSEVDAAKLRGNNPNALVVLVENGVEIADYSDQELKEAYRVWLEASKDSREPIVSRQRLVFVGSMDYHANIDAVVWFASEVWPSLHNHQPHLVFTIVGRNPPAQVARLATIPGIEVTGTVDDVRPYYHDALAAIIPLRVGGGSRLKILESMAAGVPIVSTTLGAEGLEIQKGENILIADSALEMIDAVNELRHNPSRANELREAGRNLVARKYDWSRLSKQLFEFYGDLMERKGVARGRQ